MRTSPEQDAEFARRWLDLAQRGYQPEDYRKLFAVKTGGKSGDVTPSYSALSEQDVQKVLEEVPGTRIILMVRDPIGRAWSSFNKQVRTKVLGPKNRFSPGNLGREATGLEALSQFMETPENRARSFPSVSYLRWARAFGTELVHVAFFDDVIGRPVQVIEEVCAFLGVPLQDPPTPATNIKANAAKNSMEAEHLDYLKQYFEEEYPALERVFPQHTTGWLR